MKRKSLLFVLLMALFTPWAANAQVTIGDLETAGNDTYLPMNSLYEYSYTQQIYTAEEIGTAGTINAITIWMYGAEDLYTMPFDIYMVETDKESFASTSDWVSVTSGDIVYSGSVTVHNTTAEAYTFTLTSPFAYSGSGNLMIAFDNNCGQWQGGLNGKVFTATDNVSRSIYARQDSNDYDPTNMSGVTASAAPRAMRNVIEIDITSSGGPTCDRPESLVVSDITGYGATCTWESNVGNYTFEYKKAADSDWRVVDGLTANTYTLSDLEPMTAYNTRVKAVCDAGLESGYRTANFTTKEVCPDGKICIGEGTATSTYLPTYNYYNYSLTEQIYTAEEIGQAGAIESVDIFSVGTVTRTLEFYMVSTEKETFTDGTDWIAATASNLVYNGSVTFAANSWNTIEFDNPFIYDGRSNVALIVRDMTGSYVSSINFYVFDAPSQAIRIYRDASAYDLANPGEGTVMDVKNRVRLAIGEPPACPKPTGLMVKYEGGTEAIVAWDGDATSYNIDVNGTVTNNVTSPYPLTGLALATTYEVKVQANCGSDLSEWATTSFTTDACMPEDMTVINYELEDSYGDGWSGNYILVVDSECNVVEALTISSGNSASGTLKICGQYVSFMWYAGSYPTETSWTFTDAEGNELFSGTGTASMQTYDVLYLYDNESVKRPSDLVVPEDAIGPYGAKLSWTENGTATAWQIGVYDETETLVNTVDANSNPFMLTGLQAETNYIVKVRSVTSAGQSAWTCPGVGFTTGVACGAPSALDVTPYPISAIVDWASFEEGYDIEWTEVSAAKDGGLWLQYDNGTFATSIGSTTSGVRTWGVMYPAAMLEGNKNLTKISVYEEASYYTCSSYTINIYQGADQPVTLIGTETVVPSGESGMHEITLTAPITLDLTQNLWITMTVEGTYVMMACQSNEPNNQWWDGNADGVWTNMGDDNSNLAGYGWMIRGYVEGYNPADFNWTSETGILPPYTIEDLSPETTYFVRVKASCGTDWIWASFTTPTACDAPVNLTAVAEATSATLNWVGYQDSYNLQYRTAAHTEIPTGTFFEDFESASLETNGWTVLREGEGTEYTDWRVFTPASFEGDVTAHSGDYVVMGRSWSSEAYSVDNWLISPQVTLDGELSYWVINDDGAGYAEHYSVYVSTTTNEVSAFTLLYEPTESSSEWAQHTVDLSSYAGQQGYIAFRLVDEDKDFMFLDDITIGSVEEVPAGEWEIVSVNEPTYALTGLTPETEYEWQVQGINTSCDGGLTDWTEIQSFTTLEQTIATQTLALGAGVNYVSFYVNTDLDALKAALQGTLTNNAQTITIYSQTQSVKYRSGRWVGALSTLDLSSMYKIEMPQDCEISLEGMPIDPAELPITIEGVSWIAYPLNIEMTVANCFGSFADNNDQVFSQTQSVKYRSGRWVGTLTSLVPGQGYIYQSAATESRTFVFPTSAKTAPKSVLPATVGGISKASRKPEVNTIDIDLAPKAPRMSAKEILFTSPIIKK